jgi:hypothetical protein
VIGAGSALTVTTVVITQPVGKVYVMVAAPTVSPVTMPVNKLTVATVVLLLLHVPPAVASLNIVVSPKHTFVLPVIGAGNGFTVTVVVMKQPNVYVIVVVAAVVPPNEPPVKNPLTGLIVAMVVFALLHIPPALASLKVVVRPWHTIVLPVITAGSALTVTVVVEAQPVGKVYIMTVVPE